MLKAIVCGARRARQGIGEYVCKYLHQEKVEISAIVATSIETQVLTAEHLKNTYGIECRGYVDLEEALQKEECDIVVICTPFRSHGHLLEIAAKYNKNCLCDKPLVWDYPFTTERLITAFSSKFIDTITQWPFTLDSFYKIYPQVKEQKIQNFSMLMSPISIGQEMIIDAMPHVFSMLYSVVGDGDVTNVKCGFSLPKKQLLIEFTYRHKYTTTVQCKFIQVKEQPRPAKYAINNYEVSRYVDTQGYKIYLCGNKQEIQIKDPLESLICHFIKSVQSSKATDTNKLVSGVQQLRCLYSIIQQENMNIK
ncbi:Gfo/Idh/MocA family oxidoreductase [Candidatus Uabimicrobium sp. HlEnr_7]|uniref:Gfo/Idh/MocA family oxidoreductase n=1 Tax=Candidatus Uabimicrobium helgolandensis TaxID=3095367 RepID=UPI0035562D88